MEKNGDDKRLKKSSSSSSSSEESDESDGFITVVHLYPDGGYYETFQSPADDDESCSAGDSDDDDCESLLGDDDTVIARDAETKVIASDTWSATGPKPKPSVWNPLLKELYGTASGAAIDNNASILTILPRGGKDFSDDAWDRIDTAVRKHGSRATPPRFPVVLFVESDRHGSDLRPGQCHLDHVKDADRRARHDSHDYAEFFQTKNPSVGVRGGRLMYDGTTKHTGGTRTTYWREFFESEFGYGLAVYEGDVLFMPTDEYGRPVAHLADNGLMERAREYARRNWHIEPYL